MTRVPQHARPWAIRLATTLVAWPIAFLIVLALLALWGHQLESLPHWLNALVFTAVLVPLMGNLVLPVIGPVVARRMTPPREPSAARRPELNAPHPRPTDPNT